MKTAWVLAGAGFTVLLILAGYWAAGRSPSPAIPDREASSSQAAAQPSSQASPPLLTVQPLTEAEQAQAIALGELIDSLFAVGSSGSPEEMTPVYAALRHAAPEVREAAASVLLQYAGEEALPHLRAALSQASSDEETAWLKEAIEFIANP